MRKKNICVEGMYLCPLGRRLNLGVNLLPLLRIGHPPLPLDQRSLLLVPFLDLSRLRLGLLSLTVLYIYSRALPPPRETQKGIPLVDHRTNDHLYGVPICDKSKAMKALDTFF